MHHSCVSSCPTGCRGPCDFGHVQVIVISQDQTCEVDAPHSHARYRREISALEQRERRNPPSWGELNLSWGHGPRPPRVLRSVRLVSPLIRWMAKALIGGQK